MLKEETDDSVELSNDLARAIAAQEQETPAPADDDDDFDTEDTDETEDEEEYAAGDEETDEAEETDEDDAGEDDKEKPEKKPVLTKSQKRIAELAEKRRVAEKEAFDAQMQLLEAQRAREALEARIAALEAGGPKAVDKEPKPEDFQFGQVDPAYLDAVVAYKVAQKEAELEKRAKLEATKTADTRSLEHYRARATDTYNQGKERFGSKFEIVNQTNFPAEVARDVLDSQNSVDISYFLATNLSKLRELSLLTPAQRARELGKLEERFSARASAAKKRSKAPSTPGKSPTKTAKAKAEESKYGPDSQDAFDRAFFGT